MRFSQHTIQFFNIKSDNLAFCLTFLMTICQWGGGVKAQTNWSLASTTVSWGNMSIPMSDGPNGGTPTMPEFTFTPVPMCENATVTPMFFSDDSGGPVPVDVSIFIQSPGLSPFGANAGWTERIPSIKSNFRQFDATTVVPPNSFLFNMPTPFVIQTNSGATPFLVQVFAKETADPSSILDGWVNSATSQGQNFTVLNSGNILASLAAAGFPTGSICNTANGASPKNFVITGDLTINSNFCFDFNTFGNGAVSRGQVRVKPGVSILVNSGAILNVTSCDISGCTAQWQGIDAQSTGRVNTINSSIRDAVRAVEVFNGGTASVITTNFRNNFTGIQLSGTSGNGTVRPALLDCAGNTFEPLTVNGLSIPMLPQGNGSPAIASGPSNGIIAQAAAPVVAFGNTFTDLRDMGISMHNTDLTAGFSNFTRIGNFGVRFDGRNSLNISNVVGGNSTFDFCPTSIYVTRAYNIVVADCNISNTTFGVRLFNNNSPSVRISDNTISAINTAILAVGNGLIRCTPIGGIYNNLISVAGNVNSTTGIRLAEVPGMPHWASSWVVTGNLINMNNAAFGIRASTGNLMYFNGNTVDITTMTQPAAEGFHLEGLSESTFNCNDVSLDNGGNDNIFVSSTKGFYSTSGARNLFRCNSTDNTNFGMMFFDAALDIGLEGNYIRNHRYGLALGAEFGGVGNDQVGIGEQFKTENQWEVNKYIASLGRTGAKHWSSLQSVWQLSKFTVTDNVLCPTLNPIKSPANFWFDEPMENCESSNICGAGCPPNPFVKPVDLDEQTHIIRDGYPDLHNLLDGVKGKLDEKLYATLIENPSLLTADPSYTDFVDNMNNSPVGELYAVKGAIQQLFVINPTDLNTIDTHTNILKTAMNDLTTMAYNASVGTQPDPNLKAQREAEAATASTNLESIYNTIINNRTYDAVNLLNDIGQMQVQNNWQENWKFVYDILLRSLVEIALTSQQINDLDVLARSCPLVEGDAVYLARTLMADGNPDLTYDDVANCENAENRENGQRIAQKPSDLSVYPNPGTDVFTFSGMQPGKFILEIFDARGISIYQAESAERTIYLPGLQPGLYRALISQEGVRAKSTSFSIIR